MNFMQTTKSNKKAINKAARLAWLLLYRMSGGSMSKAEYARKFGIHPTNAGIDEGDLEDLNAEVQKTMPQLKTLVRQMFRVEDLNLPVHDLSLGDRSEANITLRINHETGEIEWDPFVQKVYDEGEEIATVKVKKGATKLPKHRTLEENKIW